METNAIIPPKMNKIFHIISKFAIFAKVSLAKSLTLLHFTIFSYEIFRIGVELNYLFNLFDRFLIKAI